MAVMDFAQLGSSLSLRSFAGNGSSGSMHGVYRFGSVPSLSVRGIAHSGNGLTLRGFEWEGSQIAVRGLSRFGYAASYFAVRACG